MSPKEKLTDFLVQLGTFTVRHGNRTLGAHLIGSYNLAIELGLPEDLALACGVHSIYGTSYFPRVTTQDRTKVRAVVGERAELLARLFSMLRRESGWLGGQVTYRIADGTVIHLSMHTMCQLKIMEVVNLHEQFPIH